MKIAGRLTTDKARRMDADTNFNERMHPRNNSGEFSTGAQVKRKGDKNTYEVSRSYSEGAFGRKHELRLSGSKKGPVAREAYGHELEKA